jgi:DDE superfamily endonuclease
MLHNLLVADYGLGHPGSIHDAYAFQGTQIAQNADELIPQGHWIWVDSAYPTQTWCVVPFKATKSTALSRAQRVYNKHLSKVRTL